MLKSCFKTLSPRFPLSYPQRLFAKKFKRTKPHLNVGTIGHIDHGKTTLTSAITKVANEMGYGEFLDYKSIDKAPEEQSRGITISTTTVEYETKNRHYGHVDCPGHEDYVKNMITGAAKMDCGILVVAATDGAKPQTREHILLCKQVGVNKIILYINKADLEDDEMLHELVEEEVAELLDQYGYDSEDTPCVIGSALAALEGRDPEIGEDSIKELLQVMDDTIDLSERETDKPFLMSIESTFNIEGRGLVVVGTIEQGIVKPGEELDLLGFDTKGKKTSIIGIESFRKSLDHGEAGDNVGLLLRGIIRKDVRRGMVLTKPGSLELGNCFEAQVYFLTEEEGGRSKSFSTGFRPQCFIRTADIASDLILERNVKVAMPGDNLKIFARLGSHLPLENGLRFALRESKKTIGHGVITRILEDNVIPQGFGRKLRMGMVDLEELENKMKKTKK